MTRKQAVRGCDLVDKSILDLQDAFIHAKVKLGENTVEESIDG